MISRLVLRVLFSLGLLFGATSTVQAGVHFVDASGSGGFATVQAAVDAASDGDVILIRGGTYAGFTITGKSLEVQADVAPVQIAGTVTITGLPAGKTCVISQLAVTGAVLPVASATALALTSNAGAIRVQGCTLKGGAGQCCTGQTFGGGGAGAIVTTSFNVIFSGCALSGGNGGGQLSGCYDCHGGFGGFGLSTQGSQVAVYDSSVTGGLGGASGEQGGNGGDGVHAQATLAFASRSTFVGGRGGDAWDFLYAVGGNGGDALDLDGSTAIGLRTCILTFGAGGHSFVGLHGGQGLPVAGTGSAVFLAEPARVLQAPRIGGSGGSAQMTFFGQPGDRLYLPQSYTTVFRLNPDLGGVWQVPFPHITSFDPVAIVPASGSITFTVSLPALPPGVDAAESFLQALIVDVRGERTLGTALEMLLLRCATLVPDCDGDGLFDTCNLVAGAADCNLNSLLDACEPDCNANGVADSCDIASHTSADLNHNAIPDECEPATAVWHVDASAPPGGNGSSSNPFRTLAEGFASALSGHTVLVHPGLYTGPQNKNIDFAGRDIVVRGLGGAAVCVIDCQASGRAFAVRAGVTAAARIQGLTIRYGSSVGSPVAPSYAGAIYVESSGPTIEGCAFENCSASGSGGAIYVFTGTARIRGCSFVGNNAANNYGGALQISNGAGEIVDCMFLENTSAQYGGAIALYPGTWQPVVFSNCRMISNTTSQSGGAVYFSASGGIEVRFDGCLFAGNGATYGGALGGNGRLLLSNSTIVDNHALSNGGAIDRTAGGQGSVVDSILWGNTAPSGAQLSITGAGSGFTVSWCDVEGGQAGVASTGVLTWAAGNLDVDPRFVSPAGPDGDPATEVDNDYRLQVISPCIDAGDVAAVAADYGDLDFDGDTAEPTPLDLDHLPRFQDIASVPDTGSGPPPIVDLGAWERQP